MLAARLVAVVSLAVVMSVLAAAVTAAARDPADIEASLALDGPTREPEPPKRRGTALSGTRSNRLSHAPVRWSRFAPPVDPNHDCSIPAKRVD